MSVIIESITSQDLGSFAVTKEYSIVGAGIQEINNPINTINILTTTQVKYEELQGSQIITLAENLIKDDVTNFFDGPFSTYITSITLLTNNSNNDEVFVSCTAFTDQKKVVDYGCYSINKSLTWNDNMESITNTIYNKLYSELSLQTTPLDMKSFGLVFHCFNPI